MSISYKDAGVDVNRGYKVVELIKKHTKSTYDKRVLTDLGGFSGLYSIKDIMGGDPVLVSGTDGVGTKLKYAYILDKHDTIGIDCVAMSVNDVVCTGAKPLFFLDYYAAGRLNPEAVEQVVKGVADGCKMAECALIGGETAEMPSIYRDGEYDLAGFCVGIAQRSDIIDGKSIAEGDVLIGLGSSGVHSNGFSLVRKLLGEDKDELNKFNKRLNCTTAEAIMTPTKIYVKSILALRRKFNVKGVAHITGGGWLENIPRMFPDDIACKADTNSYPLLPIFELLKERSGLSKEEIYNTFNMGIGMVICVSKTDAAAVVKELESLGEKAYIIGSTYKMTEKQAKEGAEKVTLL